MAKYVCDFAQVTATGEKLCQSAADVLSSVNTYAARIDGDLSSWSGSAKSSFESTNSSQIETARSDAEYINALGEFVKQASSSIQKVEEELANLTI